MTQRISRLFKAPAGPTINVNAGGDTPAPKPEGAKAPIGRVVSSPRRRIGRGLRDTILTGLAGASGGK